MDEALLACAEAFLSVIAPEQGSEGLASLVRSFAGQIMMTEVRHRSNPTIDTDTIAALLRNYYLAIWHCRRADAPSVERETALEELIVQTLIADRLFDSLVEEIGATLDGPDRRAFLRRASLFGQFALQPTDSTPPDLETVLSEFPVDDLRPFGFCKLPQTILGFLEPPFRIDIANNNDFEIAVCLLTGESCVLPRENWRITNTEMLTDYIRKRLSGTFSFFVMITGSRAGTITAADIEFDCLMELKSCYLDEFGEEDKGFRRGNMLALSEQRCSWLVDHMLSGDWTDKLLMPSVA
jgi:hypothetical protein